MGISAVAGHKLADVRNFIFGLGAKALIEPAFSGMEWYADYVSRHGDDGTEGRLVSMSSFTEPWTSWEMHAFGAGMGALHRRSRLQQEWSDGRTARVAIGAGEFAINPAGVWHTADIVGKAAAVFITAGWGTEHRPR